MNTIDKRKPTGKRTIFDSDNLPDPKPSGCPQCGKESGEDPFCTPRCRRGWKARQPRARFRAAIVGKPVDLGVWAEKVGKSREEAEEAALKLAEVGKLCLWRTEDGSGFRVQQIGLVKGGRHGT